MTNDSIEQPDEATVPAEQQTTDTDAGLVPERGVDPADVDAAAAEPGREPAGVVEDATDPDLPDGDDGSVTEPDEAPEEQPAPEHGAQDDGGAE